jgi:hypothetical protein
VLNRVLSITTSPRYESSTGGRCMYVCDLCSTRLACHSDTLHETSLTHDLLARACLPALPPTLLLQQSTLHDCLSSAKVKSVSELRGYLGDRSSLLLPNFALCPLNQRIYIYTTQPRTPTPTPTPPSSTRPHTSTVATPAVRPPPNGPPERSEAPGPELRRRRWAMSGADSTTGRLYT